MPAGPSASEIPALQAQLSRDSGAMPVRLRLAEAYRLSGRAEAAVVLLEPVIAQETGAVVYLGLAYENLARAADARRIYQQYLERGRNTRLRNAVRQRLATMQQEELRTAVRAALAREREVATVRPAAATVGVFPFLVVTQNADLRALGAALAELLTTDLAQSSRLTVLERSQVQFLLDEIQLGASARTDASTAARGGRILGAGTIVQGRVESGANDEITLQAAVLRIPTDTVGANPLRERDALGRIMDLEKRLALALFARLGITLTTAERQRVTRVHTSNVQALVSFGYGLQAQDAGNHSAAAGHFGRATRLDPNFELARAREEQASQLSSSVSSSALGRLAILESGALQEWRRWQSAFAPIDRLMPDPAVRDAAVEVLGSEGTGRQGTAEIIIRRPGGSP
jgi:tetratricopeptide (TPR) repeat protein